MPPSLMDLTPSLPICDSTPLPPPSRELERGALIPLAGNFNEREEKVFCCESNFEDNEFHADSSAARVKLEVNALDQEVNVVGSADGQVLVLEKIEEDPDATEQSSSFGNTFSGSEDEATMSSSDAEVDSQFSHAQFLRMENEEQPGSDGFSRICKKKKVTTHWRRFISPLMWRCQWLELRMNELHSQALSYDKELAAYKCEKQLQSKMIELDGSVSRSVPFSCQRHRKRAMKRRKRKRIEDTTDISSYTSNHNIFSYYENKRSETDCQSVDSDCDKRVDEVMKVKDEHECVLLGLKGGDDSLEKIFLNLDSLQSRVLSLKTQLSEAMCRSSRDIFSTAPNFLQGDLPISSARSLSCSPGNNGDAMPLHHLSEYELEVPGSTVSSYGDAADVDMIECTVGLLSADAPLHQRRGRDLSKDIADDVMINNQAAGEELHNFEKVRHGGVELQEVVKEEAQSCSEDAKPVLPKALIAAPGPGGENGQPPVLKPCYTGKKRGRKPKRKRRGGCVSGLKSERIQKRRLD